VLERQREKDREALEGYKKNLVCHLGDFNEYWELQREAQRLRDEDRRGRERELADAVRAAVAALPSCPMRLVGAAVAAVSGIRLGAATRRLRGADLAIITLRFGAMVPIVFVNSDPFTLGTNGIGGIYRPEALPILGEFTPLSSFNYMVVMIAIITVAMMLMYRLQDSRMGRAWMAIREDELAAAANGINTVATKLLAFALGATTSGFAGVFNASKLTIVPPGPFLFTLSFTVPAMFPVRRPGATPGG